jgi:hypothetical protein
MNNVNQVPVMENNNPQLREVPPGGDVKAPVVPMAPAKRKRATPKAKANATARKGGKGAKVDSKRVNKVSDADNDEYARRLRTGDFSKGNPFKFKLGEILFTSEQKKAQNAARKAHRLDCAQQKRKEELVGPLVENKKELLLGFRKAKGERTVARFRSFVNHVNPFAANYVRVGMNPDSKTAKANPVENPIPKAAKA